MEKEANQLYRRPQMTGQARDEEEISLSVVVIRSTLTWHHFYAFTLVLLVADFHDLCLGLLELVVNSGGSWGLVALGPAILWGPLQWWAPTFASWGRWKPPGGIRGRAPEANAFWQQHIENWLKIKYLGRRLHP